MQFNVMYWTLVGDGNAVGIFYNRGRFGYMCEDMLAVEIHESVLEALLV